MLVLAVETATAACAVALCDDARVLAEYSLLSPRAHSTQLMPMIARCFATAGRDRRELGAVACGIGPGSFTGLRIGLAAAKALAYALRIPAVGVGTLHAIAAAAADARVAGNALLLPVLEAGRGEVYAAAYSETAVEVAAPHLLPLAQLAALRPDSQFYVLGDGATALRQQVSAVLGPAARFAPPAMALPRGSAVAALARKRLADGDPGDPFALQPLYLRRSGAEEARQAQT